MRSRRSGSITSGAGSDGGRADRHDLVAAGLPVRAGAHLVRDVARPPAAGAVFAACIRAFGPRTSAPGSRASSSAFPPGVWDIGTFADLTNIGTLFAFVVVSAGVMILRRKQPERRGASACRWVPFLPMLSIVCCLLLMLSLPLETWVRFFVWLVIGLVDLFPLRPPEFDAGPAPGCNPCAAWRYWQSCPSSPGHTSRLPPKSPGRARYRAWSTRGAPAAIPTPAPCR